MNKDRIKELAKEAGVYPRYDSYSYEGWHAAGFQETFEKFVELIAE